MEENKYEYNPEEGYDYEREENEAVKKMRLQLAQQVARVINRSMRLLGIDVPERM